METNFISVGFGSLTLKLENVKEIYGHDDSFPFNADWSILNNRGVVVFSGRAWNDGWGGPSCIEFDGDSSSAVKFRPMLDCLLNDSFKVKAGVVMITADMPFVVEELAVMYHYSGMRGFITEKEFKNILKTA